MFQRGAVFCCEDRTTGQQKSLLTRNETEARKIVQAKNDAVNLPLMNLVMAKTCLAAQDPKMVSRTWADVMEMFCKRGKPATQMRHARVIRTRPMQYLRDKRLVETTADDFFQVLSIGTNSTVLFLQTLHNDALGMGRIPAPILPRKRWPKVQKKIRRAITEAEHKLMVTAGVTPNGGCICNSCGLPVPVKRTAQTSPQRTWIGPIACCPTAAPSSMAAACRRPVS